jgi:hypothetical protein
MMIFAGNSRHYTTNSREICSHILLSLLRNCWLCYFVNQFLKVKCIILTLTFSWCMLIRHYKMNTGRTKHIGRPHFGKPWKGNNWLSSHRTLQAATPTLPFTVLPQLLEYVGLHLEKRQSVWFVYGRAPTHLPGDVKQVLDSHLISLDRTQRVGIVVSAVARSHTCWLLTAGPS